MYTDDRESRPLKDGKTTEARPGFGSAAETVHETCLVHGQAGGWVSGMAFSKQEMIGSFAMFCTYYDIELRTDQGSSPPELDVDFFGLGALPPKGQVPCRIRRKEAAT